jgi:hypothetical protein
MTNPPATEKQRKCIIAISLAIQCQIPINLDAMSKDEASRVIGRLKIEQADLKYKQALRLKNAKQQRRERQRAAERVNRPESTSRTGVRRGRAAIQAAAEPWTVTDGPVFDLD